MIEKQNDTKKQIPFFNVKKAANLKCPFLEVYGGWLQFLSNANFEITKKITIFAFAFG
jgi:hypothetical protein